MSIDKFIGQMSGGGSRGNQFRVFLTFPAFASDGSAAASKSEFLCESTSLPGQAISVTPVMYRGRQIKLAGERQFDNWDVTILNDVDFNVHNAVESWMQVINNKVDNTGNVGFGNYTVAMNVDQLDRNNTILKRYTFHNAWPTSVSPIQLNFGDNDNIERFTASFAYTWFETEAYNGGSLSYSTASGTI